MGLPRAARRMSMTHHGHGHHGPASQGTAGHDLAERIRAAGLRPTRQRIALAGVIFGAGDRHLTAESLHAEACAAGVPMSLATVYNSLHQFTQAGLLRSFGVGGRATHFDTNTSEHHHFVTERGEVTDIPGGVTVDGLPEPPEGMEIVHVDVVVRLRPASRKRVKRG